MAKKSQKTVSLDGLMLARVLAEFTLRDVSLKPNDLVAADEATIKSLDGVVDAHPDAVTYCQDQGIEPVVITEKAVEPDAPALETDASPVST